MRHLTVRVFSRRASSAAIPVSVPDRRVISGLSGVCRVSWPVDLQRIPTRLLAHEALALVHQPIFLQAAGRLVGDRHLDEAALERRHRIQTGQIGDTLDRAHR